MGKNNNKNKPKPQGVSTPVKVGAVLIVLGVAGYFGYTEYKKKQDADNKEKDTTGTGSSKVPSSQTLKAGSNGADVKELQEFLMQNNPALTKDFADGKFGTGTATELKKQIGFTEITKAQFAQWKKSGTFKADVPTPLNLSTDSVNAKAQSIFTLMWQENALTVDPIIYKDNEKDFAKLLAVLKSISSKEEYDNIDELYRLITIDKMSIVNRRRNTKIRKMLETTYLGTTQIYNTAQIQAVAAILGKYW